MPIYSRKTILAATDELANFGHARLTRFLLEYNLDEIGDAGSLRDRANHIARHLLRNPEALDDEGRNLTDTLVTRLVQDAINSSTQYGQFDLNVFAAGHFDLLRALERDGFTVDDGTVRRTLPEIVNLPAADDEVHKLLDHYGYLVPRGHLDQGIAAHARGDWAAANAQLRAFTESLFDHIAETLSPPGAILPNTGHPRRQWLARIDPPFLSGALNEWDDNGTGFINGLYRRLHPAGAHPGLSDEDDSTFRLHIVLLTARLLLHRLAVRHP